MHIVSKHARAFIALSLNLLRQNQCKEVILTNYIANRCFSEARREHYNGLITQTDIVH